MTGPATFPATLPLAGAAFTAMLQLSLPCERWPLGGIGRLWSGVAALALSWAIGVGAYFLFVNIDAVPAAERAAAGLRDPGGPVPAPDFGSALIAVGVWQALFFIAMRGWPVNAIARRPRRLIVGNILVIVPGALTYLLLRDIAHLRPDAISAACGCVIAAVLVVGMLFEGWPAAQPSVRKVQDLLSRTSGADSRWRPMTEVGRRPATRRKGYSPVQRGARFSANARAPSCASAEANTGSTSFRWAANASVLA
jgi:hypothetical protein